MDNLALMGALEGHFPDFPDLRARICSFGQQMSDLVWFCLWLWGVRATFIHRGLTHLLWIHQMNKMSPRNMLVFVHLWYTRHLKTQFYFSYCAEYSYLEGVAGNIQNSQVSSKVKMQDLNLELSGFKTPSLCFLSTTVSCCGAGRGLALLSEHSLTKCNKSFTPRVFLWAKSLLLSLAVMWKKNDDERNTIHIPAFQGLSTLQQ